MDILRGSDLYNSPATKRRPAKRGRLNVSKSHFFDVLAKRLERVKLGPRVIGYTSRSVDREIKDSII